MRQPRRTPTARAFSTATRWHALLRLVLCCATLALQSGCASPSWSRAWSKQWTLPPGERFCALEGMRGDGRGGIYLETWTPSRRQVAATGQKYERARKHVASDGTITATRTWSVQPSEADTQLLSAERLVLEHHGNTAVARTGGGAEGVGITVSDRAGGAVWETSFENVVDIIDLTFDASGQLWVAGNFTRVLRVGHVQVPVGPPHPGTLIVPRFGVKVATSRPSISPDGVRDGFLLRFDAKGQLSLLKRFHSGMTFVPASPVPTAGGVVLLASLTGSVPGDIRDASSAPIADADATKLTMLLAVANDGSIQWAQPIGGPSYLQRLVEIPGGFVTYLGNEERVCELTKWVRD